MVRKFFVGGNFKMNGTASSVKAIVEGLNGANFDGSNEIVIAPPAIYLQSVVSSIKKPVEVAAQDSFTCNAGAYTGEISPEQIKDAGVPWVILGHSERRSLFGDSDKIVAEKVTAALGCQLKIIACVGETLQERDAGKTMEVVCRQLGAIAGAVKEADWANIVVAYEPVWAIGTGKVATPEQAQDVHKQSRAWIKENVSGAVAESTRIIYGGSVNAKNCAELGAQPDIDGFLVGGASLKPEFIDICKTKA